MKFRFPILLYIHLLYVILVGCSNSEHQNQQKALRFEVRKINGKYSFFKQGVPFIVKGGAGFTYIKQLSAAGGNTMRTWDTARLGSVLDEAAKYDVNVIAGLDLPTSDVENFYKDTSKTNAVIRAYETIIDQYKDHPALMAWCIGNELDFPFRPKYGDFYRTINTILDYIHKTDPDHPVTTTLINFKKRDISNIRLKLHHLDFISINTFGEVRDLHNNLKDFAWFWDGPYLITEWAPKGGWEAEQTRWQAPIENTTTKTAELVSSYYKNYIKPPDNRCLGSLAFYWGMREETTHTWFSIFDERGYPTETAEALGDCWKDTVTMHRSPQINYLLLDEKGAKDNILLQSGTHHQARIYLNGKSMTDIIWYSWEIIKEDWWNIYKRNRPKPVCEQGLITDSAKQIVQFISPQKEGPYRLFVTIRNRSGYSASANIPFYVLEP